MTPPLWHHLVAGGLACCLSRTILSPLNVISQHQSFERLKNPKARIGIGCVMGTIMKQKGVPGFWKGNLLQCVHGFPDKGLVFMFYETCYRRMRTENENAKTFVSGATAGLLATVLLYPLETISGRLCVSYTGNLYRGLYNGILPSALSIVPTMGIMFAMYHNMKRNLGHADDPRYTMLYAGVASSVACFATWPLYGIRQRMYFTESGCANLPTMVSTILKTEGVQGLYVGCASNMIKLIPKAGIQMTAYEAMTSSSASRT